MWFWNIGGYEGAETEVTDFLAHEDVDCLVLLDSQLTDNEKVKRRLPGWSMLHEGRPHNTHKKRVFGGITVLWQRENIRICRESGYPKGVLSFVAQDTAGQRRPVAVVALYSPPLSSRLNRFGRTWSQDVLDFAEMEVHRLRNIYCTVWICSCRRRLQLAHGDHFFFAESLMMMLPVQ